MTVKIYFQYSNEAFSFLRRKVRLLCVIPVILALLMGISQNDRLTTCLVLGALFLIYLIILIRTFRILKKRKYFQEHGRKYRGRITAFYGVRGGYDYETHDESPGRYYLGVDYWKEDGEQIHVKTPQVNGNPYTYLSSLEVTVYELEDGSTYVTDFQRIHKLSDGIGKTMPKDETRVIWVKKEDVK